jgi:hypothetical protein
LEVEEVEQAGWKLRAEVLMERQHAGTGQSVEFVAQGVADALDAAELVAGGELDDVPIEIADGLRALAVGTDFERVVVLEFQQQGDFVKDGGERFAGHGWEENPKF